MKWPLALFVLVPVLNIALNALTARTAKQPGSLLSALATSTFFATVVVGTMSVICLVTLYRSGVPLPKGILFMGAMSILLGSVWAAWYSGVPFNTLEWCLLGTIAIFMAARLYQFTQ
jgi:hypothetical protein